MKPIIPKKLKRGDTIRVIAPALSMAIISEETRRIAGERFDALGLKLTFGNHNEEINDFTSSSIESRIKDLHDAFTDTSVAGILTVIGGFNSNQLLRSIDWNVIKNNPKVFCGFSDITVLNNAILTKTGLVTYSGPHYSTFGQKLYFDYTLDYFKKCIMSDAPFSITASDQWSDDEWYLDQDKRAPLNNEGMIVINEGVAEGMIVGANLNTLSLLLGTEYFPPLNETILFLEEDASSSPTIFDRHLQSLIHQEGFSGVRGVVIGRFQKASKMTNSLLTQIIRSKQELGNIPVIANVDFGHTDPKITFPIGGTVRIGATKEQQTIEILTH